MDFFHSLEKKENAKEKQRNALLNKVHVQLTDPTTAAQWGRSHSDDNLQVYMGLLSLYMTQFWPILRCWTHGLTFVSRIFCYEVDFIIDPLTTIFQGPVAASLDFSLSQSIKNSEFGLNLLGCPFLGRSATVNNPSHCKMENFKLFVDEFIIVPRWAATASLRSWLIFSSWNYVDTHLNPPEHQIAFIEIGILFDY